MEFTVPELGEFVGEAVGGGDDTEFFDAATEWIGDGGIDRAPDGVGIFVKGEFGEDEVGAVTANGGRIGGKGDEARTVGPFDFGRSGARDGVGNVAGRFVVFINAELEDFGPVFGLGERLDGLTFAGGENDPGGARIMQAIEDRPRGRF